MQILSTKKTEEKKNPHQHCTTWRCIQARTHILVDGMRDSMRTIKKTHTVFNNLR